MKFRPEPALETRPVPAVQLITTEELAEILGMSKRTIWRLLSAGQIPQPVRIGRSTRWRRDEVQRWIDSGCPVAKNASIEEGTQPTRRER